MTRWIIASVGVKSNEYNLIEIFNDGTGCVRGTLDYTCAKQICELLNKAEENES